jgi:hypothetical protein
MLIHNNKSDTLKNLELEYLKNLKIRDIPDMDFVKEMYTY